MRRLLLASVSVLALVGGTAIPAAAQHLAGGGSASEGVATDACRELPEDRDGEGEGSYGAVTGQGCDTVRVATWNLADVCWTGLRDVSHDAQERACEPLYGQQVSSGQIDAFEGGWVELAHRDQHRWAAPVPMRDRTVVATHNSYNSYAYDYAVSRMDANQSYTMTDQLRMGVRRLELDVHWFLDTSSADHQARRPVLCHARNVGDGTPFTEHFGCTREFALADGLTEIDAWLDANRDRFVMLRFENHLDGADGYAAAAADLQRILGDHLYTPGVAGAASGTCNRFDTTLTASQVLATGRHVLAVSDCGTGAGPWRDLVWDDGGVRRESTYGAQHRAAFRAGACPTPWDAAADAPGYPGGHWIRFYNDATWLSATATGRGSMSAPPADATPEDAAAWMRCGVNQPAFDFLTPTDGRMEAMVWSWAPDENLQGDDEGCAVLASTGRFHSEECGGFSPSGRAVEVARGRPFTARSPGAPAVARPYLCRTSEGWAVTSLAGDHADGDEVCAAEFGGGFAFPRTAREAVAANTARQAAAADEVWLALRWTGTTWAA